MKIKMHHQPMVCCNPSKSVKTAVRPMNLNAIHRLSSRDRNRGNHALARGATDHFQREEELKM